MTTTTLYSVKGGSGTSVTAAALASIIGRTLVSGARLLDLDGDARPLLGLAESDHGRTVWDYLHTGDLRDIDSAVSIAAPGLGLLDGGGPIGCEQRALDVLLTQFDHTEDDLGPVVIDAGTIDPHRLDLDARSRRHLLDSTASVLVLRPCYLALRRALTFGHRPDAVVLIEEPGRALGQSDVRNVLGVSTVVSIPWDASIARAVDAGMIATRSSALFGESLDSIVRGCAGRDVVIAEPITLLCAECLASTEWGNEYAPVESDPLLVEVCESCGRPGTVVACRAADPLCVETCAPAGHGRSITETRCACCGAFGACSV